MFPITRLIIMDIILAGLHSRQLCHSDFTLPPGAVITTVIMEVIMEEDTTM